MLDDGEYNQGPVVCTRLTSTNLFLFLSGASSLQLPTDFARPLTRKYVDRDESFEPSPTTCKAIVRLALELDSTPFSVVLSICLIVLHKFSMEEDIIIGSSNLSGLVLLRLVINGSMKFSDVLKAVQEEEALVEKHQLDFAQINTLRPAGADESEPLCQVRFFNLVDVTDQALEMGGQSDWSIFIEQMRNVKQLLPLRIRVSYNSLLFSSERMKEFLRQLGQATEAVIALGSNCLIDQISIVTPVAKQVIPDPTAPLSDDFFGPIQSFLQRRAQEHPDRILVEEAGGKHSYKTVNSLSNRVANFLIKKGGIQVEDVGKRKMMDESSFVVYKEI